MEKEPYCCVFVEVKEGKMGLLRFMGLFVVVKGVQELGGVSIKPCSQALQVMPKEVKANPLQ